MRTKARRVVIAVFDEVELLDVAAPLEVLSIAGRRWNFRPYKVELVCEKPGLVSTRNQLRLEASGALGSAEPAEILLVPGGYGARRFAEDAARTAELRRLGESAEVIVAIGLGVLAIARAGLVGSSRVAVSAETAALLEGSVAERERVRDVPWLESERVLSARSSGAALELSIALVRRTMGPKLAAMVSSELELAPELAALEIRYSTPSTKS